MAVWLAEQVGRKATLSQPTSTPVTWRDSMSNLGTPAQHPRRPARCAGAGVVRSRLFAIDAVSPQGVQEQAIRHGGVPAPRWLAVRRGRRLGTAAPVDPAHPRYDDYQQVWRDGDWWTVRGYDKALARNCRPYSSALGSRASALRPPPRWCAEDRPGEMVDPHHGSHQQARRRRRGVSA
jgi:hypothetical protein